MKEIKLVVDNVVKLSRQERRGLLVFEMEDIGIGSEFIFHGASDPHSIWKLTVIESNMGVSGRRNKRARSVTTVNYRDDTLVLERQPPVWGSKRKSDIARRVQFEYCRQSALWRLC